MTIIKEILTKTREILVNGWGQGEFVQNADSEDDLPPNLWKYRHEYKQPCYCLSGAIHEAMGEGMDHSSALLVKVHRKLADLIPDGSLKDPEMAVYGFNDHKGTTKEMVLALLDQAIAKETT